MDEDTLRDNEAQISAMLFISEVALIAALRLMPPNARSELLSTFLTASKQPDHLRAVNDHDAEWISDVFVRTQVKIEASLRKAAEIVGTTLT